MKIPKVLVAAPTYSGKHYIFPEWYKNITKLDYPNYDWLIVDNSKIESYAIKLRREGYKKVIHVPRGGNSRVAIARASEYIRRYALDNGYDYLLFVETDLIPPKDIIQTLISHRRDVIGCVYEIGITGSKSAPRRPLIYHKTQTENGMGLQMLPINEAYDMVKTGVRETKACGFGCTLLKRNILEKYPFKYSKTNRLHTDMIFYWELDMDNVPVYIDTDIIVPHFNQNWNIVEDF